MKILVKAIRLKLSSKISLWMVALLAAVGINSYLGISALLELNQTDGVIARDYEVALRTRQIREALFEYHNYGLIAALTRGESEVRDRDRALAELRGALSRELSPSIGLELHKDFDRLRGQVGRLLEFYPGAGKLALRGSSPFLDPFYREIYGGAFDNILSITSRSAQLVEAEWLRDEQFFRANLKQNAGVLTVSLFLLSIGIFFIYRSVLKPLQEVAALLSRVRGGDLSVRWTGRGAREIVEMGWTVEGMASELERRRRERVEFVGSVAHDFKNPVTAIQLNCELALREGGDQSIARVRMILSRIQTQASHLARIADDLLKAAKEERPIWELKRGPVRIETLVREAMEAVKLGFPKHRFVSIEESAVPEVDVDAIRLKQVLINLLSNAAKYSSSDSECEAAWGSQGGTAYIEVRDRGVGIPGELREAIFEPFSRLESGREMAPGTGLGLAIAKDIVRAHGGSLRALERAGGGSVFRIELRLAASVEKRLA